MPWKYHDQTYIPKLPAELWPLISTLEGMQKWYIRSGRLDPTPGGEFYNEWNEQVMTMCHVVEIVPNERFAFSWAWDTNLEPPEPTRVETRIDFWLEPAEDGVGSYFHIEHGEFPGGKNWEGNFFAFQMGWTKFLMCLKGYAMAGIDMRDFWVW